MSVGFSLMPCDEVVHKAFMVVRVLSRQNSELVGSEGVIELNVCEKDMSL